MKKKRKDKQEGGVRVPIPRPGGPMKDRKDYDRKREKHKKKLEKMKEKWKRESTNWDKSAKHGLGTNRFKPRGF